MDGWSCPLAIGRNWQILWIFYRICSNMLKYSLTDGQEPYQTWWTDGRVGLSVAVTTLGITSTEAGSGTHFYAVRRGYRPGIYLTWPECQHQVYGFSRAQFKCFASLQKAERFMEFGFSRRWRRFCFDPPSFLEGFAMWGRCSTIFLGVFLVRRGT
jgi:hypothetical protein